MAFIDGGNQKLLGSSVFSVQINRVYFNIFQGKKRILPISDIPKRIEFLSVTLLKIKNGLKYYETFLSPIKDKFWNYLPEEKYLTFKAGDREIQAADRPDIERVASMARRFAEWKFSEKIIDLELGKSDILVRDGSLQTSLTCEKKYTNDALKKANEKKVIFAGLSKTSTLPSSSGLSVISSIQRFADENSITYDNWCYGPIARANSEVHKAVVMAVKLNKHSDKIFRFEVFNDGLDLNKDDTLTNEILEVVSSISTNSNDYRTPGYPYGLYDADLWAKVRNEEISYYETRLKSELSKRGVWKTIESLIKNVDASNLKVM